MSLGKIVTVWCDGGNRDTGSGHAEGCREWIGEETCTSDARSIAAACDWQRRGRRDYSPQCAARLSVPATEETQ